MNSLFTKIVHFISILLLLLQPSLFKAQNDSSKIVRSVPVTSFWNAQNFASNDSAQGISSNFADFQHYISHYQLGNTGLNSIPLFFSESIRSSGFQYAPNYAQFDRFTFENLAYYNTRAPYSSLFYVIGTKKEQLFDMSFSYNLKKNWNITGEFRRIRSEGFYKRQQTNNNDVALNTSYTGKKNHYGLLAALLVNYRECAENGGLQDDSLFTQNTNSSNLLDVNLLLAKSKNLHRGISLVNYWNVGASSIDSIPQIQPRSRLSLTTTLSDQLYEYWDDQPNLSYYPTIVFDSSKTYDSAYYRNFENVLSWKTFDHPTAEGFLSYFGTEISLKDQLIRVQQKLKDSSFNNVIPSLRFYNLRSLNGFNWNVFGDYVASGYNAHDYSVWGDLRFDLAGGKFKIYLQGASSAQQACYQENFISSNHFRWNNQFEQVLTESAGVKFLVQKWRTDLSLKFVQITDPVYFDAYASAQQYHGSIQVFVAKLKQDFSFFNWHLNNRICYQLVPDSTVLRFPALITQNSLFYEHDLFHKATRVQVGVELFYNTAYYASRYMPVTGEFYLQDAKKYGNYPFFDFFLNAQVKNFRLFFKVEHLNAGLSGYEYLSLPNYPMAGRSFKLGISWRFFD